MKLTMNYPETRTRSTLAILIFLLFSRNVVGQELVTIPNTMEIPLVSSINDIKYNIQIAFPEGYEKSKEKYPTIYLLDSNDDFPLLTAILRRLQEVSPEKSIIVGIAYQEYPKYYRRQDYTPSNIADIENSGGADLFYSVLKKELIPVIEEGFNVKKDSRTMVGHSLGGLLGAYLLANKDSIFDNYILSSPSIWWDDYLVLNEENNSISNKRVFISVGSEETTKMLESFDKLKNYLNKNSKLYAFKDVIIEGETHASSKIKAYTDGLRWLLEENH